MHPFSYYAIDVPQVDASPSWIIIHNLVLDAKIKQSWNNLSLVLVDQMMGNTIHWMTQLVLAVFVQWIVIYLRDSTSHWINHYSLDKWMLWLLHLSHGLWYIRWIAVSKVWAFQPELYFDLQQVQLLEQWLFKKRLYHSIKRMCPRKQHLSFKTGSSSGWIFTPFDSRNGDLCFLQLPLRFREKYLIITWNKHQPVIN